MPPTSMEFHTLTLGTWKAMLKACREAKLSIDIEQYIFQNDEIGSKFIEIFKQKVKSGVKVRMLIDMVGSQKFYSSGLPEELRELGVEIRFFNRISPWRIHNFTSWFFRNHKKTLIIDKTIAFTGGTGVGFHMADWRDTTARMQGEVTEEVWSAFQELWWFTEDRRIIPRIRGMRKTKQMRYFITNSPYHRKRFLYYVLMESLHSAQKSIYLTTPYFIPDRRLRRILRLAAQRGVDVKIIVPKLLDVPIVESASHSLFEGLLKNGVKIYKYQPRILHAKTAVVDGEWATFGSFNLDSLSFLYNFEANVATHEASVVQEINKHFHEDLAQSEEVTLEAWNKRGWTRRFQEILTTPFRGFL
ncbi:MAG: hypothetical protein EXS47_01090 [Candidatus Zambryskibacteria bacterium]|nr:hypothetical protein [Candidatus Zambryskibacteria bacterium]